jgi:DNA-binding transcriptional ArsR family regulator
LSGLAAISGFLRAAAGELVIADCTNMQLHFAVMGRFDADTALRALSHPHRRRMLQFVADVERTSSDLSVHCRLSRPATSQHLKVLREADLVSVRADGNRRLYRARADRVAEVLKMLDRFWGDRLAALQNELEDTPRRRHRP